MAGPTITQDDLNQFHGGGDVYRHPLMGRYVYTEGVRFLARRGGCYWLVDAIFSHQLSEAVRKEEFQVWTLTRSGAGAALVLTNGNDDVAIVRQEIEFTDFPMDTVSVWLENGVLMLPSER